MVSVIRLLSTRSTVGAFFQFGPEQALPVRHDVLGEVEEGGRVGAQGEGLGRQGGQGDE